MELEDGLFYLNAGYCGKSVKTLLDIGAEYTSIDQSLADELGVRIFQDSLRMSPASYMKLGILDSLQIGFHHPQKRDLLCLPRRSGGTESGSDRRFGHHTDPGDAGDFDAEETIGPGPWM